MTASGARQHLSALADDGLVEAARGLGQSRSGSAPLLYAVTAIGRRRVPAGLR